MCGLSTAKFFLNLIRAFLPENRHRYIVGPSEVAFHLLLQVTVEKREVVVEPLLIISMASLDLPVVSRSPLTDQLVLYAVSVAKHVQRMDAVCFGKICEFRAVIRLKDVRNIAEEHDGAFEKIDRGEVALLFVCVNKSFSRCFLYDRSARPYQNSRHRHIVDIHLPLFRQVVPACHTCRCAWIFSLWIRSSCETQDGRIRGIGSRDDGYRLFLHATFHTAHR